MYNGSETTADKIVSSVSPLFLNTPIVASAAFEKTPSVPEGPIPSTISLVKRNGTISGVVNVYTTRNVVGTKVSSVRTISLINMQTELIRGTYLSLFKDNTKINVNNFTSLRVDENIGCVTISNA